MNDAPPRKKKNALQTPDKEEKGQVDKKAGLVCYLWTVLEKMISLYASRSSLV